VSAQVILLGLLFVSLQRLRGFILSALLLASWAVFPSSEIQPGWESPCPGPASYSLVTVQ
jgi:hypothetical protein